MSRVPGALDVGPLDVKNVSVKCSPQSPVLSGEVSTDLHRVGAPRLGLVVTAARLT